MTEQPILSVSEISLSLKSCVEQVFGNIKVRGEVSDVKRATSGHIYFSLKDKDAVLSAICWRGKPASTTSAIQEGLEIICQGKLSTYPGRSNYQMIIESAEPAGVGALLKLLQERKERLEKEGLFDPAHKQAIPFLPEVIGVVTSPTGAVIRDIIHRISDRFPRNIILWPVAVQGEEAAEQIAAAIQGFNQLSGKKIPKPDVLIVARGGGSLEDLWCFNEECVVRAVYESKIPVISAVGHETDTTLIDYVADLRAPTPTGAAEKAVPVRFELNNALIEKENLLKTTLIRNLTEKRLRLTSVAQAFPNLNEIIQHIIQRLDDKTERLNHAFKSLIGKHQNSLVYMEQLLKSYSYHSVLKRGFALVSHGQQVITSAKEAQKYPTLTLSFADGKLDTNTLKNIHKTKHNSEKIQYDFWDLAEDT